MGGGGSPKVPKAQKLLMKQQAAMLSEMQAIMQESQEQQRLLMPALLEQMGIEGIYDDAGTLTGYRMREDELDPLRKEIEKGFLERSRAALAGELPVNPALMKDLSEREKTLEEELVKDFGSLSAARTSTAGQMRLREFEESKEGILEGARRGDLTMAEQLGIGRQFANQQLENTDVARISGLPDWMRGGAQGYGTLAQLYGQAQQPYMEHSRLEASSGGNILGQLAGVIGGAAAAGIGSAGGADLYKLMFK